MNNVNKDEIQSRREFFKKAAKAVLPVIGAIALNAFPIRIEAKNSTDCSKACVGSCGAACTSCWTGCTGSCKSCANECSRGCTDKCGGCGRGCEGWCDGGCKGYCSGGCKTGCGYLSSNPGQQYI